MFMVNPPSSPKASLSQTGPADPFEEQIEWQLNTLQDLVEAGVELARSISDQILGQIAAEESAGDVFANADALNKASLAFTEVSDEVNRLIRMQLRLQARLEQHRENRAKIAARVAELTRSTREAGPKREAGPAPRREFRRGPLH